MKLSFALGAVMATLLTVPTAFAVDGNVQFNGSVPSSCAFSSSSAGTLDITGTTLISDTAGTITVINNDPGTYNLSLGATTLGTSPDGQTLTSVTATPTVTGDNAGITLPATLTNAGTDVVSVELTSGVLDDTATAGTYIVTQVVTCL